MFSSKNARVGEIAKRAGIELTDDIEFFAELIAEECAYIVDSASNVKLEAADIIRGHFSLLVRKH